MDNSTELPIFAREILPSILDGLLESRASLEEVAARSYTHENGFVKIVLQSGAGHSPSLRLHIWVTGSDDCGGNIHNHCWDFSSYIVSGELGFEEFVQDESGSTLATHLIYEPSSGSEYRLKPVGEVRLRVTRAGAYVAGEVYAMEAEILHRTWARSDMTITLLRQGPRRLRYADVFATKDVALEARERQLQPSGLKSIIEEVRSTFY